MKKHKGLFTLFFWGMVLVGVGVAGFRFFGPGASGRGVFDSASASLAAASGSTPASPAMAGAAGPVPLTTTVAAAEGVPSDTLGEVFVLAGERPRDVDALEWDRSPGLFTLQRTRDGRSTFSSALPYCAVKKVTLADGNTYDRVTLPGAGHPEEPGMPNITGYRTLIRIPKGARADLVTEEIRWAALGREILLDPLQLPIPDVALVNGDRPDAHMPFVKNEQAYARDGFSLRGPVVLEGTVSVRGKSYAVVAYRPLDVNPRERAARLAVAVTWSLLVTPVEQGASPLQRDALDASGDAPDAEIDVRSEAQVLAESESDDSCEVGDEANLAENADYLIITDPEYAAAVAPLAEWKRKKGYRVYTATMAEVGQNDEDVREYIRKAYHDGIARTAFVLLVGDHEDVPSWKVVGHPYHGPTHVWHTDYDYACVDGDDRFPDLTIGRLPGDSAAEITVMVNKILTYEKTPPLTNRYNHMLVAGQFQDSDNGGDLVADRMFMEDLHRVADFLGPDYDFFSGAGDLFNKGYTVHSALQWDADRGQTLRYASGWGYGSGRITPPNPVPQAWKNMGEGDKEAISSAINDGVSLVLHRDHGYADGSGWADPYYTATPVRALSNGTMTPVVFSLNCATGWFDGTDSFAEAWIKHAGGGAVGFTGAARVSYSGYNDLFHVGIFDSFWNDYDLTWESDLYPLSWSPAMALNRAKHRVFDEYGEYNSTAFMTARLFNWLGDPEMELRTRRPGALAVTHPESILSGVPASFQVTASKEGVPLSGARVAVVMDKAVGTESHVVFTGADGIASFSFTPQADGTFSVTVTEHDALAYEGEITAGDGGNQSPVADAGSDQSAAEGATVTLTGSGSFDPDGTLSSWLWEQVGGTGVTLSDRHAVSPTCVVPDVLGNDSLVFRLTVTDNNGRTASDTCVVTVNDLNVAPVAEAGPDRSYYENSVVTLDGSGSADADGRIESYRWDQVSGPAVVFSDPSAMRPTFVVPVVTGMERYEVLTLRLTVTDDLGLTGSDTCRIYAFPFGNRAPLANAGSDLRADEGTLVQLDGSGSMDPDGTVRSYQWEQVSGPVVGGLTDAQSARATFTAPEVGLLESVVMKLTVTDDAGASASDACSIDIVNKNKTPQAHAGGDVQVLEGAPVTLDGSGSRDPDGRIDAWGWEQLSGPAVTLANADSPTPSFTAPDIGPAGATLGFRLTVTDNEGATSRDTCAVTVGWVNVAPTADAGPDQAAYRGERVALAAGGSSDPDDGIATIRWEQLSGPPVTLYDKATATPWFRAVAVDADGEALEFRVTVTDRHGLSASDRCVVNLLNVNMPPVADAGPDLTVSPGAAVGLDGSNSFDVDGDLLSFAWVQTKGPAVSLANRGTRRSSFQAPAGGAAGVTLAFELTVSDAGALLATDTVVVDVSAGGLPPVAAAGPDQRVAAGEAVVLSGANSSDPDDGIASYAWRQIKGPPVALSGGTSAQPTFTATLAGPEVALLGFELTVTDRAGLSATDTCNVHVCPANAALASPVADAGGNQTVRRGTVVTLDGSRSVDPEGGLLTYRWRQTAGAAVTLSDPAAESPHVAVGPEGAAGDHSLVFALTVTNDSGLTDSAIAIVNVCDDGTVPVADAGADQAVEEGVTVTLDASRSTGVRSFFWEQTAGRRVTLSNPGAARPTFVTDRVDSPLTVRRFRVTVENSAGLKSTDDVSVTILDNGIGAVPERLSFRNTRGGQLRVHTDAGDEVTKLYPISDAAVAGDANRPDAFASDLLDFEVRMVTPGDQTAMVQITLPEAAPEGFGWYKFSRKSGRWIHFDRTLISGGTGDGAVISPDRTTVTLYLTDNGPYDDNDEVGLVRDPGGLAQKTSQGGTDPTGSQGAPASGGSGGGGCALSRNPSGEGFDPTLLLLVSLSVAAIIRRRRKN